MVACHAIGNPPLPHQSHALDAERAKRKEVMLATLNAAHTSPTQANKAYAKIYSLMIEGPSLFHTKRISHLKHSLHLGERGIMP